MASEQEIPRKAKRVRESLCERLSRLASEAIAARFYKDNASTSAREHTTPSITEEIDLQLELTNAKIGLAIALHPWNTIICVLLLTSACCVGLIRFETERDPMKLWVPPGSKYLQTTEYVIDHIGLGLRMQNVLIVAPNVLEPRILKRLVEIRNAVIATTGIQNGTVLRWDDVCMKIPYVANIGIPSTAKKLRKRRFASINSSVSFSDDVFGNMFDEVDQETPDLKNNNFDPSVDLNPSVYCKFLSGLKKGCYERNILDIWNYDEEKIGQLTTEDVINSLIKTKNSPISGHEMDYIQTLGGTTKDIFGNVRSAKALMMQWPIVVNFSASDSKTTGNMAGTETWVTLDGLAWEDGFIKTMSQIKGEIEDNETHVYFEAAKSFGDISAASMFKDSDKIIIGIVLMFIYIQVVLSKFSWIELRIILGGVALLTVGLAFVSACGMCSILGIPYGPVHTSLPFLLMGLGVDDLFVMMACWREIKDKNLPVTERVGLMLKHAGASITVTSFTDVIAFLVGAFTILPSLQSFCIYAAFGVFMTYIYALTFMLACFTLDEYRISAKRNAFLPFIIHNDDKTEICCEMNFTHKILDIFYKKFALTKPGKIIIILTVIGLSGYSLEGLLKLEQKFDKDWFIPQGTYLQDYLQNLKLYFPDAGYEGFVFTGRLNYTESLPRIYSLVEDMEKMDDKIYETKSWIKPFQQFVLKHYHKDIAHEILTDTEWRHYLSKFLHSPNGGKHQANFRFDSEMKCGEPSPNVTLAWIDFQFLTFNHRTKYLPAMHQIEDLVASKQFTSGDGFSAAWGKIFANWITDEVIDVEVMRNILLALLCVMVCTFIVIIDLQICFWIFVCVLLTLINICGFMQRWGLTVDLVFCIGLELAAGLCVDYAAHIGHTFLTCSDGNLNKRALDTVEHIGAAVIYGGGSTLLALGMLSTSEAYTFRSFFKIFFLVIIFGLFHGVVFLPVILSIIGPRPYKKTCKVLYRGSELEPISANGKDSSNHCAMNDVQDEIKCESSKLNS